MRAADIMTHRVVTVGPETTIAETAQLMLKHRVSGLPVVDDAGGLVGIVSEGDLMRRPETGTERHPSWWLRNFGDREAHAQFYIRTHGLTAAEVMTRDVLTIDAAASLAAAAELMEAHRVKRLPVMRGGKMVGIVSRANLIHALAMIGSLPAGARDDTMIRRQIEEQIEIQPWVGASDVAVTVLNGVVNLWGRVESMTQREAAQVLAQSTPGVAAVKNHLAVRQLENRRSVILY